MTLRDFAQILADAGLSEHQERFARDWIDQPLTTDFLAPEAVEATCVELGMSLTHRQSLRDGLDLFVRVPALQILAAQLRRRFCQRRDDQRPVGSWPCPPRSLHPAASLFYAYVVLGCVADTCAFNAARGIPATTTRAVFVDLERWMDEHQRHRGFPGFDRMGWLWLHIQGRLHQLGRLQFEFASWQASVRAFRQRDSGAVALLMQPDQELRRDGRHQGIAGSVRDPDGFITTLVESPDGWHGHRVSAQGTGERQCELLPRDAWSPALTPGDPVLFLHIPAGGGLTPQACAESCRSACAFFSHHFPARPFQAIVSTSWMFDPQLAHYLPADSNLVRFQRAFHLHPSADLQGSQIRERVLGHVDADWRTITPTTSLQRAVIDHYRQGGLWCQHGAVLFADELGRAFGESTAPGF